MKFAQRQEDIGFVDSAPTRHVFEAEIGHPVKDVFQALSADPTTWSWFPGVGRAGYATDEPYGVGTKRFAIVGGSRFDETIIAWDEPTRYAYRVDSMSVPLAKALVETWDLAETEAGTKVRWTFAVDPTLLMRGPVAPFAMRRVFERAMANLERELDSESA